MTPAVLTDFTSYDFAHSLRPGHRSPATTIHNLRPAHQDRCLDTRGAFSCSRSLRHPGHHIALHLGEVEAVWFHDEHGPAVLYREDGAALVRRYEGRMAEARAKANGDPSPAGALPKDDPAPWADTARSVIIDLASQQGYSTDKINRTLREAGLAEVPQPHDLITVTVTIKRGMSDRMRHTGTIVRDAIEGGGLPTGYELADVKVSNVERHR